MIRPIASANDVKAWNVYDAANRLVKQIDAAGAVSETLYDGASRVVQIVHFAPLIDTTNLPSNPSAASIAPPASSADRISRNFYDDDGLLRGQLDGEGDLSEIKYNAERQEIERIRYA